MSPPETPAPAAPAAATGERSPLGQALVEFFESWLATGALVVFVMILAAAVAAPVIAPQNPYDLAVIDILDARMPPGSESFTGMTFWLGTDDQGRDMLSAILYGLRISLFVAASSAIIALLIGTSLGLAAAFFGGRLDTLLMRIVDLQLSFPAILIALILIASIGQGVDKVIIALVAIQWAYYARTVRAAALVERQREYVLAAMCLGLPRRRILFRHLLPNCMPSLIVVATVQIAVAIAVEATLSFLGIGLPITEPSLGLLVANGFHYMMSGHYWISVLPGVALLITIVSVNLVGDRLRDLLNPRTRQ